MYLWLRLTGSGKTTLVRFIIDALEIDRNDVIYIAYTGKAAEVLRRSGCPNAMTAHKLLYYTTKMPDGKYIFKPRLALEWRPKLIVVDEVSMLPKSMWDMLLRHHVYVIACGDPFQLPPIRSDDALDILNNPHVFLDEIMRQALDNEIIRLSMHIREGIPIDYYKGTDIQVIRKSEVVTGMYDWADEIITATNKKRDEINTEIRNMKGFGPEPQVGDKLISLTNHWDCPSEDGDAVLVNGTIGYIEDILWEQNMDYRFYGSKFFPKPIPVYCINFNSEANEKYNCLLVDKNGLITGNYSLDNRQEYILSKRKAIVPYYFNYGYAITCHRAQGSQWDKVLLFEESFPFDKEQHARWLYTGVTRAAQKLVLVR